MSHRVGVRRLRGADTGTHVAPAGPGSLAGANRGLVCGLCGAPMEPRQWPGGRVQRYCSARCQRLGWCRDQLEAAGYRVTKRSEP